MGKAKPVVNVSKYCRYRGIIIIVLGILHIFLLEFLDLYWGGILIIIGLIALIYRSKNMIVIFCGGLILVGILNIRSIIYSGGCWWLLFGIIQIAWGIQELGRYKTPKENPKYRDGKKEDKKYSLI